MNEEISFGRILRERRTILGLTQTELARRAHCAAITIRKIEADALRPSVQMAEQIALALNIPEDEQIAFVRLARQERDPSPIPTPSPLPGEIGLTDLSGRAVKGFQLAERIGSGGYGVVYRATQRSVKRDVAVKIILPRYANRPSFIRRFEAEAQLIARLEHPHIVPLYDYWREPDAAYLIMRLLRGGNLEDQLSKGPVPIELVYRYAQQMCLALETAHKNGIVHRDIKPANVLLDEENNVYLADFGIAKDLERQGGQDLTTGSAFIGSPAYISPEQILSEPVKPQSDIYCLGILLFEMLTGCKPFSGPTPIAFIQQHLNESLPSLQAYDHTLPTALDEVIHVATAKRIANRYQDILSFLRAFQNAVSLMKSELATTSLLEEIPAQLTTTELAALENPYVGLRAFSEADADHFYGRSTLIQELFAKLSEPTELA
ncbi:MAG: protein kinase, partial [Chloroflexota bacterium]